MNKKIIFLLISTFGLFLLSSCVHKTSNTDTDNGQDLTEEQTKKHPDENLEEKFLITDSSVGYFKIEDSWQNIAKNIYNYKSIQGFGLCMDGCCGGGFSLGKKITLDDYNETVIENPEIIIGAMVFDRAGDYEGNKYTSNPMDIPEGAPKGIYEMTFIYKVNGENKEFSMEELENLPEGAEFVDRKEKFIKGDYPSLNKEVFYPYPNNCGGWWYWKDKTGYIVVHSNVFKTKEGIGVGTTLENLQEKFGKLHFYVGWIEEDVNALQVVIKSYPNIEFILSYDDYKGNWEEISLLKEENSLTISDFKKNTKIKRLIVNQTN